MGKISYLDDHLEKKRRKNKLARANLSPKIKAIPIATFAKRKFTLGIYYDCDKRCIVVYNTTTKVPIGDHEVEEGETREDWMSWAELVVSDFQSNRPK